MSQLPSPSALEKQSVEAALRLYPSLVAKFYASRIKDGKKVAEAVERDQWRFVQLPTTIAEMKLSGGKSGSAAKSIKGATDVAGEGLSKEAVERLVQWKINHGQYRPFLPGMVRKNNASAVEEQTAAAFQGLSTKNTTGPSKETVKAALDKVCKLTGIGPATGTLILNIYDPDQVPFFQDEMFFWFFPNLKGGKLKYDQKEYLQLFDAVGPVLKRLDIKAIELEKVSFVLAHARFLEEQDVALLRLSKQQASLAAGPTTDPSPTTTAPSKVPAKEKKGAKRKAESTEKETAPPASKRPTRRQKS